MKWLASALCLVVSMAGFSQQQLKTKIYSEKIQNGSKILVDNDEFCPVSMKIKFELNNMSSSNYGNNRVFVIPAKTKGFFITNLTVVNNTKPGGYSTKAEQNYGDATVTQPIDFNYALPFQKGNSFAVHQGYNGNFSHQGENSLDFTMPVGTEIVASRDGVVVKVIENNSLGCPDKSCVSYNNLILIYHNDGTFTQYVHLKQNGALVNEGDVVKESEIIGYSGQTGWASGPHLHFMAFIQRIEKQETLRTKFKINDGKEFQFLKEKETYTKNY